MNAMDVLVSGEVVLDMIFDDGKRVGEPEMMLCVGRELSASILANHLCSLEGYIEKQSKLLDMQDVLIFNETRAHVFQDSDHYSAPSSLKRVRELVHNTTGAVISICHFKDYPEMD